MSIDHRHFYFVRHGETDLNKQGIIMGSIDEPLNERGLQQAQEAALLLKHNHHFDLIVSSSRKRALQTAQCIADHLQKPLYVEHALTERVWGEGEGKPYDYHKSLFDIDYIPTGAEPFRVFQARILAAITDHLKKAPDKTFLFVSHGGVFKALCYSLGNPDRSSSNAVPHLFRPPEQAHLPWAVCNLKEEYDGLL